MVDIKSTAEAIKKAYRDLSKRWHPDKMDGDVERFKEIASAWEILSDPEKKKQFDEHGFVCSEEKMVRKSQALVKQVFQTLVGQYGMGSILQLDVMQELKGLMKSGIQEVERKVMEAKRNIADAQSVLAKFTFKNSTNPIRTVLDDEIEKQGAIIDQMNAEKVIAKRTYDLLSDYEFDSESAQFKQINFGAGFQSTTGNIFTGSP
jgi:curved DNA-binding protein CbpA